LIAVEIVRKNPDQVGFAVNPRRWVVERFFAWIGRNRRLAKDFEATIDSARAFPGEKVAKATRRAGSLVHVLTKPRFGTVTERLAAI
jgi:transposase